MEVCPKFHCFATIVETHKNHQNVLSFFCTRPQVSSIINNLTQSMQNHYRQQQYYPWSYPVHTRYNISWGIPVTWYKTSKIKRKSEIYKTEHYLAERHLWQNLTGQFFPFFKFLQIARKFSFFCRHFTVENQQNKSVIIKIKK